MTTYDDVRPDGPDAYDRWQHAARDPGMSSVLDVVRSAASHDPRSSLMVRALGVVPVYVDLVARELATSRSGEEEYVHVWSTPVRLTTALAREESALSITEVALPDLLVRLAAVVGVRIDPDLESEIVLPPALVEQVLLTARGVPTPAALTPVEGEVLRVETGPEGVTDLDARVRSAVLERNSEAGVRRAAATLAGLGGRVWPVYSVSGAVEPDPALSERVQRAAGVPIVLLVDGRPERLAELVDMDAHGKTLTSDDRGSAAGPLEPSRST